MSIRRNVVFLFSVLTLFEVLKKCTAAAGPCVYDADPRGAIDFSSIGQTDGTPKWKNQVPTVSDGHVYSYNPCHSFSQGPSSSSACKGVAACQMFATDETLVYSLGSQDSIQWTPNGAELPSLTYKSIDNRILLVNLRCLTSGEPDRLEVHGYDAATQLYIMVLSSKCACWGACKGSGTPGGISGGTIFIILLVVLLVIYIIGFTSFNKFKRQATGLDILPHRTFWFTLPGLARDGAKFIFHRTTGKSGYTTLA